MRILSCENWDISCSSTEGIAERTAAVQILSISPNERGFTKTEIRDQNISLISKQMKPALPVESSAYERMTSAIFDLRVTKPFSAVMLYEVSEDAEDFINRQKGAIKLRKDLLTISERVSTFLRKEGIETRISISLFRDPEYDDWIEPKIKIGVPKDDIGRAYSLYSNVLAYSLQGIRKRTLKRLFVTIESK